MKDVQQLVGKINESTQESTFLVDGVLNQRGSGADVVLEGPNGVLIKQSLYFEFQANNNQSKYKALSVEMKLAGELRA
ncbi:hypothetical protein CR513_12724, partial [Mucuna pruriens]